MSTLTTTIANGTSLSPAIDLSQFANIGLPILWGISTPDTWTAADWTFQVSLDGGVTYENLYDGQGNEYSMTVSASRYILIDPAVFKGIVLFKIRSGSLALPVNQAADRILKLNILRG